MIFGSVLSWLQHGGVRFGENYTRARSGFFWPTPDGSCFHFGFQPSVTEERLPSPFGGRIFPKWLF
jgi:hypothetical protein